MVDSGPISWQRTLIFRRDSPSCLPRSDIRRILMPAALWIIELSILLVPTLEFDQDGRIMFRRRSIRKTRQPSRAFCGRISDHPLIDQVARVIKIGSGWKTALRNFDTELSYYLLSHHKDLLPHCTYHGSCSFGINLFQEMLKASKGLELL